MIGRVIPLWLFLDPSDLDPSYLDPSYLDPSYLDPSYLDTDDLDTSDAHHCERSFDNDTGGRVGKVFRVAF